MRSHARVNSKSVRGAPLAGGGAGASADAGAGAGWWLGISGAGCARTKRVSITVSLPDMGNMPPPTRPTDFASRACLASLNDAGVGFCVAGGCDVDVDGGGGGGGVGSLWVGVCVEGDSTRELMGFRRSLLGWGAPADVEGGPGSCGVSSSMMVIGTRRRFGGAEVVEVEGEDVGRGGGVGT